ncbi:MAG TPA: hypothetical protein VJO52_11625 [Gemmatimonadaceae bacterium]|nr:hypothetical protein [Gemmatimonadaceae bacterium]
MQRSAPVARIAFAVAMITLGVIGLLYRDFELVWGPLPSWVHGRTALACVCAAIALALGILLLVRRTAATASLWLVIYVALWMLLVRLPSAIRHPLIEVTWESWGEIALLLSGAWSIYADLRARTPVERERGLRFARVLFGLALIPIGLSHFAYLANTAGLVPSWLPFRRGWVYLTGTCHLAAALGSLLGVLPKLAAALESVMLGIFTVFVWIPLVVAQPRTHGNWTEIWTSFALTVAAAVVAVHAPRRPRRPENAGPRLTT